MSNKKPDEKNGYFLHLLRQKNGGNVVTYERTETGVHADHMNAFYASLNPEQQAAFVSPLASENERADFEASLTSGQSELWSEIQAEADKLGHYVIPDTQMSDLDKAACGLRTMFDRGVSDDPAVRAIQKQTIKSLGGEDSARQLAEQLLDPDFVPDPEIQETLIQVQNGEYSYEEPAVVVQDFFGAGMPEEIGTSNGGALPSGLKPDAEPQGPVPESPTLFKANLFTPGGGPT